MLILWEILQFSVFGRHIVIPGGDGHAQIVPSHSPDIFRKVTKGFHSTPNGYEMAAKRLAWG